MSNEPGRLASGQLTTIDCVAQSLAGVGPIFSAAALGSIVAGFYVLMQWVGHVGFAKVDDWAAGGYAVLARGRGHHWSALLIELAVLLNLLAVGIGATVAVARGGFTLARDGLLPAPLAATNSRGIPAVATTVVSGASAVAILIALAIYGTGPLLAPDGAVVFPEKAFQAFLVTTTISGFLVCICYALVALGALATFATKKSIDLIAALVGLATCVLGVAAQFIEGTAPTGDATWGLWLGLIGIGACVLWIAVSKRENLEKAGAHALQHTH